MLYFPGEVCESRAGTSDRTCEAKIPQGEGMEEERGAFWFENMSEKILEGDHRSHLCLPLQRGRL